MNMVRECFVLPGIFLTVTLLGGFRVADGVRLVPPPLMALVLGMLLLGCLVRAGVVMPDRLMNSGRSAAANLSGLVVLMALFGACAQVFNLVTPDTGLLHVIFSVFFLIQLLTTMAAVRDRIALLRGLAVLLGSAFLIRFVALDALYAPEGGLVKRMMTAMMEGITLGALDYAANRPATGYVALFTLTIFMIGLVLTSLEDREPDAGLQKLEGDRLVRTDLSSS